MTRREWTDLLVGDVVRAPSGAVRVVMDVHDVYGSGKSWGHRRTISFVKIAKSWTDPHPFTAYGYNDMRPRRVTCHCESHVGMDCELPRRRAS